MITEGTMIDTKENKNPLCLKWSPVSGVGLEVFAQTGMWTSCGRLLFLLQSKNTQTFIREVLSAVLICEWQATAAAAGLFPNTAGGYTPVTFNLWLREGLPHLSRWHHLSVSTVAPSTLQETRVNAAHICPTSRYYLALKGFGWRPRSESWSVICILYHRRLSWCVRTVRKSWISVIFRHMFFSDILDCECLVFLFLFLFSSSPPLYEPVSGRRCKSSAMDTSSPAPSPGPLLRASCCSPSPPPHPPSPHLPLNTPVHPVHLPPPPPPPHCKPASGLVLQLLTKLKECMPQFSARSLWRYTDGMMGRHEHRKRLSRKVMISFEPTYIYLKILNMSVITVRLCWSFMCWFCSTAVSWSLAVFSHHSE